IKLIILTEETIGKKEEILASKVRTNCQQKLTDQMKRFDKVNNKLLNDLNNEDKNSQKEVKALARAQQNYDEKKRQVIAAEESLNAELQRLQYYTEKQIVAKVFFYMCLFIYVYIYFFFFGRESFTLIKEIFVYVHMYV
ncbi:hypothetical protein RFI_30180, partial [Reticulomyxa filosa]